MRIVRVTDAAALRDLYEFRYRVYVAELGWLEPSSPAGQSGIPCVETEAFLDGALIDHFDAGALNYAAYDDEARVVGSIRVVPDSPDGLPVEECWSLDDYRDHKQLAEICRLAVVRERRGTRLSLQLMKAAWQGARRLGVSHVLVDAFIDHEQRTHDIYRKVGFRQIGEFSDTRYLLSEPAMVMVVECESGEESLPPHLRTFFRSHDPLISHGA